MAAVTSGIVRVGPSALRGVQVSFEGEFHSKKITGEIHGQHVETFLLRFQRNDRHHATLWVIREDVDDAGWTHDLHVRWSCVDHELAPSAPPPDFFAPPVVAAPTPSVVRGLVRVGSSGDGGKHSPAEKIVQVYSAEPIPPNGYASHLHAACDDAG